MIDYLLNSYAGLVASYDAGYFGIDFRVLNDYARGRIDEMFAK